MRRTLAIAMALCCANQEALAQTIRFTCEFRTQATQKGVETIRPFRLEFTIDPTTGKAILVGNAGMESVIVVRGENGLTFLEQIATGAVQSTTIAKNGTAVHSRHTLIAGELVPAQMYGQCHTR